MARKFSGFEAYDTPDPNLVESTSRTLRITRYAVDAVVCRQPSEVRPPKGSTRGTIRSFSWASCRRLIWTANNVHLRTMITATMTPAVFRDHGKRKHDRVFRSLLESVKRRFHCPSYLWIREFQQNGSLHWHVFLKSSLESTLDERGVDITSSRALSEWFADQYENITERDRHFMSRGNGDDFLGCVRVEQLRKPAGHYAGKEAGKRYQKVMPDGWTGRFWGASRDLKPVPVDTIDVPEESLAFNEFGQVMKLQFNKGKR